jgi:Mce-associated membrane protein
VTNTGTGTDGQVRYYRLRLRLVREDDRWLTSDLQFVR